MENVKGMHEVEEQMSSEGKLVRKAAPLPRSCPFEIQHSLNLNQKIQKEL
jgi:hypothetical protein